MFWGDRQAERQAIGGERRSDRRYEIVLEVQWKLVHRRRVVESGTGRTHDLSSHGILFDAGRRLVAGRILELSIAWPVLLHGTAAMKLVASGKVVRSNGTLAAIRMTQHEFYTTGIAPGQGKRASADSGRSHQTWDFDYSGGLPKN
jgi:hypothetical protein